MGEVYRASDLRLGQTVALKLLPDATGQDPAALARFYNEVRIARQVTHPNACRVFDIGDIEGQPFLSMQYVDGENLASLLLRIGRLPADKAIEISRRLCAGLAAAHSQGVLHRDLKPANIMIDGRGQVLIADFGLAGVASEITGADIGSGTPAYMSPEQLAGKEVTVKSDIYALGLVIYEMFTGKRAFAGESLAELVRLREESKPLEISSVVREVDPAIERIILRCLDPEPKNRPASALAVSAALPGGDPLAAALAAGETPSPEMVAASGERETLRPHVAIASLAVILIGIGINLFLSSREMLLSKINLEQPSEALAVQARKMIQEFGVTGPAADQASGYSYNEDHLDFLERSAKPRDWSSFATGQPSPIRFWYRESPVALEAQGIRSSGRVTLGDPPAIVSGMASVILDPQGRLEQFTAVPLQVDESQTGPNPDPAPLFRAAALDFETFRQVPPQWTPLAATDYRAAWSGTFRGRPDEPIRVEAAWWRGKPVYFEIIGPWTKAMRMPGNAETTGERYQFLALSFLVLSAGSIMAWRNHRLGRGDRGGAFRLAGFAVTISLTTSILAVHGLWSSWGLFRLTFSAGSALWNGALLWVAYMALEPAVRHRWPRVLISWTRLLSGGRRDFMQAIFTGLILFFLFFLLRTALRKEWLAGIAFVLFFVATISLGSPRPLLSAIAFAIVYSMIVPMLLRFGLLSFVVTVFVANLVEFLPFTLHFSVVWDRVARFRHRDRGSGSGRLPECARRTEVAERPFRRVGAPHGGPQLAAN
jgi:serine/threonine-protein kinase